MEVEHIAIAIVKSMTVDVMNEAQIAHWKDVTMSLAIKHMISATHRDASQIQEIRCHVSV